MRSWRIANNSPTYDPITGLRQFALRDKCSRKIRHTKQREPAPNPDNVALQYVHTRTVNEQM